MPQPLCYVELGALDVVAAARFYSRIFGWQFTDPNQTGYSTFGTGDGIGGGIYRTESIRPTGGILLYIMVEDITAALEQVTLQGGRIVKARSEISGVGWFGHFSDPWGNVLGLFTPGT